MRETSEPVQSPSNGYHTNSEPTVSMDEVDDEESTYKWLDGASTTGGHSADEDDYVKRLEDELELVTEQLIEAEQRLSDTEEKLADAVHYKTQAESKQLELEEQLEQQKDALGDASQADVGANGAVDSADLLKLKEENGAHLEKIHKLEEEIELTTEELTLTQDELKAAEEDAKTKSAALDGVVTTHREELVAVKAQLEKVTSDAHSSAKEIEALEETMKESAIEAEALQLEVENLNVALKNSKKDYNSLVDEMESLKLRYDEAQAEAKTEKESAVEELKRELLTAHESDIEELRGELESTNETNEYLKTVVQEKEKAVALAREVQDASKGSSDSQITVLERELAEAKEELAKQKHEASKARAELDRKLKKAESDLQKAETEVADSKVLVAEAKENQAAATAAEARASHAALMPLSPLAELNTLKFSFGERAKGERSQEATTSLSDFGRSHARSRTLQSRSRRGRSSSPTTLERLESIVREKRSKIASLNSKAQALVNQNRMSEVRVTRLESELKESQENQAIEIDDSALVSNMRGFTPASGALNGELTAVDENDGVEEVISSGDSEKMADELRNLFKKSSMQRDHNAQLLNRILRLQGNIQVCCRIRPMKGSEIKEGQRCVVDPLSETEIGCFDERSKVWKSFAFDKVWGPEQPQQGVFQDVEPLALSVVDGYNACIFAYGQTGSGKTYTMEGMPSDDQYGISHRTIHKVFQLLHFRAKKQDSINRMQPKDSTDPKPKFAFNIEVGMLEIYNDEVYDLLSAAGGKANTANGKPSLEVRRSAEGRIEVPNLTRQNVESLGDVLDLLKKGNANRAVAATNLNEHSSRSHMILQVQVKSGLEGDAATSGSLYLVDLAGSERTKKSEVEGKHLKEAGHINKSLSALGNVMEALDRKASHIPFRDSKLTYLLQDSLGGNSKTMMVVTVCPTNNAFDETQYALQFATRVRRINLGTAQRNVSSKNLEETVKSLTMEMKMLAKAKDKSETQLLSLKRDHERIKDRLTKSSESRTKNKDETRTMAVLRQNNTDMAGRWQKEKTMREEKMQALEDTHKELRKVQQQLLKAKQDRDSLNHKVEENETTLINLKKDLRDAKDATSAANIRARRSELLLSRNGGAPAVSAPSPKAKPLTSPAPAVRRTSTVRSTPTPKKPSATESIDADEVRTKVLALLEKHDPSKVGKIDAIMEKFKGKEKFLLHKMTTRYEADSDSKPDNGRSTRTQLAMERHMNRMKARNSTG